MWLLLLVVCLCEVRSESEQMLHGLRLANGKPGIVIDVGANGGTETLLALKANRTVLAVECLSTAYMELQKMFVVHHDRVTLIHMCAGSHIEMKTLHLADDSSSLYASNIAGGKERVKASRRHNRNRGNKEVVISIPLDSIVQMPVALIKVDVQGFEGDVLLGSKRLIETYKPVLVYEDTPSFIQSKIDLPIGYSCRRVGGDQVCLFNVV